MTFRESKYFLPYQIAWIRDRSSLKIMEKSRQIGITFADAYDSVRKVTARIPQHVWVCSKDEDTAMHYLEIAKEWARILHIAAEDLGERVIDSDRDLKARVLRFATGKCIYALSSNVNAPAARSGHIKLDEFALHPQQRLLYRHAEPATTWGGTLSIISTHRGSNTVFNELLRDIKERGNPMGWSHHRVDIHDAVRAGLVEKINQKAGANYTREEFILRCRQRCIDQEHWLQEYCCVPCDDNAVFIDYEMLSNCQAPGCMKPLAYLTDSTDSGVRPSALDSRPSFYIGVDVARKKDLCVIDVGEKIGDVLWDRLRLEFRDTMFSEVEAVLFPILALPQVKRCCIDATGLGIQLSERAKQRFGYKVEPITFTAAIKEEMAFDLRRAFEDRLLRIDTDPKLHADLRGIKKLVTSAGHIRFAGDTDDSHCDRFWAKALRQHAAKSRKGPFTAYLV